MDIMKLTRELGRALQQDQTYINMSVAEQQCNEDEALQNAIGEFNLKRMAINNEAAKEDRSEELIEQYNKELREIYGRVMQNEHMAAYQAAKNEFDALMQRVTGVLSMCAEGQDPDGCDPDACGMRTDVMEMKDLKPGMVLTGTVRNVIDFGAFVDIGVHQDGLVHISQISSKFIKHPSEVLTVGDVVKVVVLDVDEKKNRISLSIKQAKDRE